MTHPTLQQEMDVTQHVDSKPLLVLLGPTAIGKSQVAIRVAKALDTEILTADSTQVYRGMDIGTDKPSATEQHDVPHRLIDLVDPDQAFNAGQFRRHALVEIERLHRKRRLPFIVGGTGLYIRVLLRGLWSGPSVDWEIRGHLEAEGQEYGLDELYRQLVEADPDLARQLHSRDRVKIIRGLEVYRQTGTPLSQFHSQHRFQERHFHSCVIGLTMDRQALYRRIDARVEMELSKGLVDETQRLLIQGYHRGLTSMKSLGYRQISSFLSGECDFPEAVRRLKRDTRHFAKRQMTWFRREPNIDWIDVEEHETPDHTTERVFDRVERFFRA